MGKSKKILIYFVAVFLIPCIMQWNTAYAASSSQSESSGTTVVSDGGDAEKGTSGTEGSEEESSGQGTNEESENVSDQDENGQQEENSNQDDSEQQEENSNQDGNGQQEENLNQDVDNEISDGSQGDDEQMDQDQEEVEDDDEWADGDDEWTDAWTGADDEMEGNEWADDVDKNKNKNENKGDETRVASVEPYNGSEVYSVENVERSVSSKSNRAALDQSYQTGAGLGYDIFLILAVICGIMALGLSARKRKHKN